MQKILILLSLLCFVHLLQAQNEPQGNRWLQRSNPLKSKGQPVTSAWHTGTAGIIKNDGAELSLFNPSRIGLTKNTELLLSIGEEWILPNFGIKHHWAGRKRFLLSSQHTLYYTWPLLKLLQSTGIKDLIADSVKIGHGIAMRNEILFSWLINPQVAGCPDPASEKILTFRGGVEFYAGQSMSLQPFDWFHSLYHTQIFDKKLLYYSGLQFDSYFSNRIHYSLNALFYNVDFSSDYSIEGNARFTYYISRRIGISASCKVAYMKINRLEAIKENTENNLLFAYNNKAKISVLPLLDVTFLIHPDRGEIRHGLFKNRKKMK